MVVLCKYMATRLDHADKALVRRWLLILGASVNVTTHQHTSEVGTQVKSGWTSSDGHDYSHLRRDRRPLSVRSYQRTSVISF